MMPREVVSDGFISRTNRRRISPGTLTTLTISLILLFVLESRADTKHPPAHPVDLNAATAERLQQVPGMGPSTAKAIATFLPKSSPFQRIEDLLAIKGISKARLGKSVPI
jgi:competence ComEA-like helix-hairpin-helix protein